MENTLAAYPGQSGAGIQYCLGMRLISHVGSSATGIPIPVDVFYSPISAIVFGGTFVLEVGRAFSREVDGVSIEEFSHSQMNENIDPSLGVGIQRYFQLIERSIKDFDPVLAREYLGEFGAFLQASEHLIVTHVGNVISQSGVVLRSTHDSIAPATVLLSRIIVNSKKSKPVQVRTSEIRAAVTKTMTTIKDDIAKPVMRTRRRLLSFGSWLYDEVENCAINVAIIDVFRESLSLVDQYFSGNFQKGVDAFTTFNSTHRHSEDAIPTDGSSLAGIFAVDQLIDAFNLLTSGNVGPEVMINTALDLVTCNIDNVMLCSANQGLIHKGKFVILLMILFTISTYLILPEFIMFAVAAWGLIGFAIIYSAYGVSPFCFPMIPTCLADDMMNALADIMPAPGELEIVRLTRQFKQNGHSISTCDQEPYNFVSLLGNIAYTFSQLGISLGGSTEVPGRSNVTIPGPSSFAGGWFPLYNATATANDDTYRMCNYLTWVRNGGYSIAVVGVVPIATALTISGIISVLSLLYLLAFGVFAAYILYTGPVGSELSETDEVVSNADPPQSPSTINSAHTAQLTATTELLLQPRRGFAYTNIERYA
jgi:hypothetical protein